MMNTSKYYAMLVLASLILSSADAFQSQVFTKRSVPLTRQGYASSVGLPLPSPQPNFDDMRESVRQLTQPQQQTPPKKKHVFGNRPDCITEVSTVDEFQQVVEQETERISVVRFYQTSCRSCKAATPAFDRIVQKHP